MKNTGLPSIDKTHLRGVPFHERNPIIPNFISVANALKLMAFTKDRYVVDCMDLRVKVSELKEDSRMLAKAFIKLGTKPGDIIACAMPNLYQTFLVFMAANTIGAITTYLNPYASKEELKDYLNLYESKIFINYDFDNQTNKYFKDNSKVEKIISLKSANVNSRDFYIKSNDDVLSKNVIDFNEIGYIAKLQNGKFKKNFGGSQECLILHTSGSTGNPKSMVFTNENVLAALIYLKHSTHTKAPTEDDCRWMNVVPFMYPYGFLVSVLGPLFIKREIILVPSVSAERISDIYNKKPHLLFGSPAFLELTQKNLPNEQNCSGLKIFISGGDFLSEKKSREGVEFFKSHGACVQIANGSGNGEVLGCCSNSMNVEYRPETVGQLVVGPDYLVIDEDTKKEVKYGEMGVLCILGKHIFTKYYKNEADTKKVMIELNGKQYYNTGNYGILHRDRYFELIGRSSRFYIIGTLNKVYCELVQRVICMIDEVDSCVVVPKTNDENLYEGKAYIKLKHGFEESDQMKKIILDKCHMSFVDESTNEKLLLKEYEIPASISFVSEIKRHDGSDKIDYEYYKKEAELEYQRKKHMN